MQLNMKSVSIITLDPTRWQEAKNLRLEALQQDPSAFGSSYEEEILFEDDIWKTRLNSAYNQDGNMTLYAEFEGQLVGLMGAGWSHRIKYKHVANIYSVYVTESMRGHGIGSQLLQTLLDRLATKSQIKKVSLTVTVDQSSAVALYEKFGFKQVGIAEKELKIDGQYYDIAYMEKLL